MTAKTVMLSVENQWARILEAAHPLPPVTLPLTEAHGLRVAQRIRADLPVPPWDNSAMDGFAVRYADLAGGGQNAGEGTTLRVVADLPAGAHDDPDLADGEAARIMTGAPIPTSADTVVQLEHTDQLDPHGTLSDHVTVYRQQRQGRHVRRAGEDLRRGDPVIEAGTLITATTLASLASAGHGSVTVRPPARVAVISTGSELVPPGQSLHRGQIPDSNSLMVSHLVAEAGARTVAVRRVSDDPADLATALDELCDQVDVMVLTGGVSAGAYDPVTRMFAGSLDVRFVKVAMQPGKPQAFGRYRGALLFGLPGNPVSVWVSFHVFVQPALAVLHGVPASVALPVPRPARASLGWSTPVGRRQYLPARIALQRRSSAAAASADGAALVVRPSARLASGSHAVGSLTAANGYAMVSADTAAVAPGDLVDVVCLSSPDADDDQGSPNERMDA